MATAARDSFKILLITTVDSSYPGADTVGQMHLGYAPNTYIIRVPDPVMLPEEFFLYCLKQGFDGIIVMSSGAECPFEGTFPRLTRRMDALTQRLKSLGLDFRRVKLCAICTVCTASFLKEVRAMNDILAEIGPMDPSAIPDDVVGARDAVRHVARAAS